MDISNLLILRMVVTSGYHQDLKLLIHRQSLSFQCRNIERGFHSTRVISPLLLKAMIDRTDASTSMLWSRFGLGSRLDRVE